MVINRNHLFYITGHAFMLPLVFETTEERAETVILANVSSVAKNDMPLFQCKKKMIFL